jgi:hypothetical protein
MARWKLMTSHYLHTVEKTEWEYKEVNRTNGREVRKQIPVPRYLDIRDPQDWTNRWGVRSAQDPGEGEIIVCLDGRGEPGDIAIHGDPTPDMVPMDDEAQAISDKFTNRWQYKPDGEVNYSQSLVDKFESQMADVQSKPSTVQVEGLSDLVAAMAEQSRAIASLLAQPQRRV